MYEGNEVFTALVGMVTDGHFRGSNQWSSCADTQSFVFTDAGVESAYGRVEVGRRTIGLTVLVDYDRS